MRLGEVILSAAVGATVAFILTKATQPPSRPSRPLEARAPILNEELDNEHARFDDYVKYLHRLIDQIVQPGMTELEAMETREVLQDTLLGLSIAGGVEILESAPPPSYEKWEG